MGGHKLLRNASSTDPGLPLRTRKGQGFYKIPCSVDDLRIKRMLMAAYLPETSPIATPDQIILVLGDFPGDVWLDHGVILVATLGCDRLRSSGVATHMGEERIATIR